MNYKRTRNFPGTSICCALLVIGSLSGCSSPETMVSETLVPNPTGTSVSESSSSEFLQERLDGSTMFSDRDKEIGYDEEDCILVSLADESSVCADPSVTIDGNTVTIAEEGVYLLSGSLSDGQIIIDVDKTEKVQLVLDGVDINCSTSAALYVRQADKVFVTLAAGSVNCLGNREEFVPIDENNIDAVIFSRDDITFNGTGSLTVNAVCGHGIVSKNDLRFTGGSYTVIAASTALSGEDSVRILDGSFTLTAQKDAIHSENTEEEAKGYIYIAGGSFTIDCGSDGLDASSLLQIEGGSFAITAVDDGAHADRGLIIDGGTILISSCYEGLESSSVVINGGEISLTSTDDGVNGAGNGGRTDTVVINGGLLRINASGDGIDSNGSLFVNGGEIYVSGPTNSANGALDYETEAVITGGTLVATGSGGMAENFGDNSTQGSLLVSFTSYKADGNQIILTDESGNVLVSYTPDKSYSSVVVSCPELSVGKTYMLSAGSETLTIEMSELIYGRGMGGGFGGRDGAPGGRGNIPGGMDGAPGGMDGTHGRGDIPGDTDSTHGGIGDIPGSDGNHGGMGGIPGGSDGAPGGRGDIPGGMNGTHDGMGGGPGGMNGIPPTLDNGEIPEIPENSDPPPNTSL